ncbi:MAG: hypothetical protein IM477_12975 [Microcystis sp. M090S1]|nr:hypothetical protein [Microcystis sp. M090S1]
MKASGSKTLLLHWRSHLIPPSNNILLPLSPAPRSPHQPIANAVSDLILDSLGIDRCCGQS